MAPRKPYELTDEEWEAYAADMAEAEDDFPTEDDLIAMAWEIEHR